MAKKEASIQSLEAFLTRAREVDQAAWVIGSVEAGEGIRVLY